MKPADAAAETVVPATAAEAERIEARYAVTVVRDAEALNDHLAAWNDLAQNLIEPNPYYESWAIAPAVRHFGEGLDLEFVFVYLVDGAHQTPPLLCGFFPLERRRIHKFLPISVAVLWQHLYCFLCTPLVRHRHASPVIDAFLNWLSSDGGAPLLRMNHVSGDGAFARSLADACYHRGRPPYVVESYCRAVIEPHADAESYIREAQQGRNYKRYRRKIRGLAKLGQLDHRGLDASEDIDAWAEMFLQLEAKGWKGRGGTAMACKPADAAYFRELVHGASAAGKLVMLGLFLDDKPLAMHCDLNSGPERFGFKMAFDEDYASTSPGKLLQLANIRKLHEDGSIRRMDSCAVPDAPINQFWMERRLITSELVATGRAPGDLLIALVPLVRWLKRRIRAVNQPPPTGR
ncbi:GNAT family N-acetyltransferase [Mycolicibacterium baixiangningiae]|uniref:GNAT family N-acetyltransferase n=1 Tax=Mycolicibacterium baixiangningiae TaxID=2761578 RepID=UPI0027DA92EE|nr:GNAT family N-acetyltransferase [Mycolicibacterium baixiangningiae]